MVAIHRGARHRTPRSELTCRDDVARRDRGESPGVALRRPAKQDIGHRQRMITALPKVRGHPAVGRQRSSVMAALRQHFRRAKAVRELKRLLRSAPTATVRNDLMTIAPRNEHST